VFNLGHGITPDVDPARVAVVVDTVRNYVPK
jgi:uroporphyrinogen-III decarboxylase